MTTILPTISDITRAHERIKPFAHYTPVLFSSSINKMLGVEVFFKCENFQKVGAFKFRGACNAVYSLSGKTVVNGVATHSSGNHAAALALAASMKGIKSYIVMPENAPQIKKNAVAEYGGIITFCKPTLQAREDTLNNIVQQTHAAVVHPYNNFDVVCGQGTATIELEEQVKNIDAVFTPVGGGGLLSGTAIAAKSLIPGVEIYAGEPEGADDASKSFISRTFVPAQNPKTIADGLLTSLGDIAFALIMNNQISNIFTVTEEEIIFAMRLIWERMKIIIEPSSAVPFASLIKNKQHFQGKRVAIILSGGNVDLNKLPF